MQKQWFSLSVYRMWLRRYWVGGLLMGIGFLLSVIPLGAASVWSTSSVTRAGQTAAEQASRALFSTLGIPLVLFVGFAAIVAAMLCTRYLQQPKAAVMMHALPIRRETLLFSTSLAGITLLFAPILGGCILYAVVLGASGLLHIGQLLIFMLALLAFAFFWFATTTFMGMVTGSTIAQCALTLLVVNLPQILELVAQGYLQRYLFGYSWNGFHTGVINPFFQSLSFFLSSILFSTHPNLWIPVGFLLAGVVFMALAYVLYRFRRIEAAGDVIAAGPAKPVFKYGLALLGAILFGSLFGSSAYIPAFGRLALELLGGVIGYFGAEMLLGRTVRVFRRFKGLLVFAGIYCLAMCCLIFDVAGYGRYQLQVGDVFAITTGGYTNPGVTAAMNGGVLEESDLARGNLPFLQLDDYDSYLEDDTQLGIQPLPDGLAREILEQDPSVYTGDSLEALVALQNYIAERAGTFTSSSSRTGATNHYTFRFTARLQNGRLVQRSYSFWATDTEIAELKRLEGAVSYEMSFNANLFNAEVGSGAGYVSISPCGDSDMPTIYANGEVLEGFFEAYLQDVTSYYASPYSGAIPAADEVEVFRVEVGPHSKQTRTFFIYAYQRQAINWLVDNGYVDKAILDIYAYPG